MITGSRHQLRFPAPPLRVAPERIAIPSAPDSTWETDRGRYVNRDTGAAYCPHREEEQVLLAADTPRWLLVKGGEGSGKSVFGVVKGLERLRRGMSGIMGSTDFEHMKKSLWPEFQRWCPPNSLIPDHRYRLRFDWVPQRPFTLAFRSGATLLVGGFDDPASWEGPNVNWAHFDEGRRHRTPAMLKVLDGRLRIAGPQGEPPQAWITTTPRKHWLYQYFVGPLHPTDPDLFAKFRADATVLTLRTVDNRAHLAPGFLEQRARSLTEREARELLDAEWEDTEDAQRFLPSMLWWDTAVETLPPMEREPLVLALDAAVGRQHGMSDCWGLVGVTRHPADRQRVAVRIAQTWQAKPGEMIDFDRGPVATIRAIKARYRVAVVVYDPYQLVATAQHLTREGLWCKAVGQVQERLEADKHLLDCIMAGTIAHDGHPVLRAHLDNADRKIGEDRQSLRLVKGRGPIDLAVCLSMAAYHCLRLAI